MPKFNGNAWNMTACNRLVAQRIDERRHEKHLQALEQTKTMVDHRAPDEQKHLRNKLKTKKLQEDRAAEIQLENRILLQKMLNIDTKPSPFNGDMLSNGRVPPKSLHGEAQRRELDRITMANQDLLRRLQSAKPSIDPRVWEEEEMDRQALKFRLSQNSCRGRVAKHRMPEKLLPAGASLPRLGGNRFQTDDWANLTNTELDRQLRELENGDQQAPLSLK